MDDDKQHTLNFSPRHIEKYPNLQKEEFIPISYIKSDTGEEIIIDNYHINKLGQIKNIDTGRLLSGSKSKKYISVSLKINGISKPIFLHRLLAGTFLQNPNPNKYNKVNHIDHDGFNNSLSNLEWVTHAENMSLKRKNKRSIDKLVQYIALNDDKEEVFRITRRDNKGFDIECNIPLAIRENRKYKGYYWKKEDKKNILIPGFSGNLNDYEWHEHWKYPGLYVCKEGFIRNSKSILGTLFPSGYMELSVFNEKLGRRFHTSVHRIIMEFIINRDLKDKEVVDHINTIKHDNSFDNLKLCNNQRENLLNPITMSKRTKLIIVSDLYGDFIKEGIYSEIEKFINSPASSFIYNCISKNKYICFYKGEKETLLDKMRKGVIYVFSSDKRKVLGAYLSINSLSRQLHLENNKKEISMSIKTGEIFREKDIFILRGKEAVDLVLLLGHGTALN